MNPYNAAFLLSHPDFTRKLFRRPRRPKVIVMALKPKYAKAIYEGRKTWEFRKVPPPLFTRIYIYESAPVSAVTGWVDFSESVTGIPLCVWDMVKAAKLGGKNLPGLTYAELTQYAGDNTVTALHVYKAERLDRPIPFEARPPQNWGRFAYLTTKEIEAAK